MLTFICWHFYVNAQHWVLPGAPQLSPPWAPASCWSWRPEPAFFQTEAEFRSLSAVEMLNPHEPNWGWKLGFAFPSFCLWCEIASLKKKIADYLQSAPFPLCFLLIYLDLSLFFIVIVDFSLLPTDCQSSSYAEPISVWLSKGAPDVILMKNT